MKTLILVAGVLLATISGFVFAGILGAIFFGSVLTLSICAIRKIKKKEFSYLKVIIVFLVLSTFGYVLMMIGGLLGADKKVLNKLHLIEKDLEERNYKASWIIISQKRSSFFNSILDNSADKSLHLKGIAIDVYVFDVNGDGTFDKSDIKILYASNNNVEKKHPELMGAFGDYYIQKNGYLTKHMIHIDTRGYKKRYTQ